MTTMTTPPPPEQRDAHTYMAKLFPHLHIGHAGAPSWQARRRFVASERGGHGRVGGEGEDRGPILGGLKLEFESPPKMREPR